MHDAVSDAIDSKVEADGNVNALILAASLKGLEEQVMLKIDQMTNGEINTHVPEQYIADGNEVDLAGIEHRAGG